MSEEGIWFAGKRCVNFSGTRSPGIDPDFAFVTIPFPREEAIRVSGIDRLFSGGATVSRGTAEEPGVPANGSTLPAVGDVVVHRAGTTMTLGRMVLRDDLIEQVVQNEGDFTLLRVGLMDVRGLWRGRGELFDAHNRSIGYSGGWSPSLNPATLRDDGKRITAVDAIRRAFNALPGGGELLFDEHTLARLADSAADSRILGGLQPVEVLGDLLQQFRCEIHLALDGRRFFVRDAVPLDEDIPEPTEVFPLFDAAGDTALLDAGKWSKRTLIRIAYAPDLVRVRCGAHFREGVAELVPVGIDRVTQKVVPIDDAAASWGMSLGQLGNWITLPEEEQNKALLRFDNGTAVGNAAQTIRGWAFRMYQLPPEHWHRLPIEEAPLASLRAAVEGKEAPKPGFGPDDATLFGYIGTIAKVHPALLENSETLKLVLDAATAEWRDAKKLVRELIEQDNPIKPFGAVVGRENK